MGKILYFNKNVIHQSRVASGAPYVEPEHIHQKWDWNNSTWMRKRLAELAHATDERKEEKDD